MLVVLIIGMLSERLQVHGISDSTENSFFSQKQNSLDVIYIGSCHAYSSIIPSQIEAETGLKGYVLGGGNLDAKMMYYYLKAALERQNPRCVVLEVFSYAIHGSYVSEPEISTSRRKNAADLPFVDRMAFIWDEVNAKEKDWIYYLFDIGFFHDNWTENGLYGKNNISEDNGWFSFGTEHLEPEDIVFAQNLTSDEKYLQDESREYFFKSLKLLDEKGIDVLLFAAPYLITDYELPVYNEISCLAEENGIPFFNMIDNDLLEELNFKRGNMLESRHVNMEGARFVSARLADFISKIYK